MFVWHVSGPGEARKSVDSAGMVTVLDPPSWWRPLEYRFDDLTDFYRLIRSGETGNFALNTGLPIGITEYETSRRRNNTIADRAQRLVVIDVDGLPTPRGLDWLARPDEAIEAVVQLLLKAEFHDVTYCWHWSASAGAFDGQFIAGQLNSEEIRARLYFVADERMTSRQMKARLVGTPYVDMAMFRPAQLNFVCRPKAARDPLQGIRLHGIARRASDMVALSGMPELELPAEEPAGERRHGGGHLIGDQIEAAAKANPAAWVPALGLARLTVKRNGYQAVPLRDSGTGRPDERRKLNLHIDDRGVRDFGLPEGEQTMRCTQLAAQALGLSYMEARRWLGERVRPQMPELPAWWLLRCEDRVAGVGDYDPDAAKPAARITVAVPPLVDLAVRDSLESSVAIVPTFPVSPISLTAAAEELDHAVAELERRLEVFVPWAVILLSMKRELGRVRAALRDAEDDDVRAALREEMRYYADRLATHRTEKPATSALLIQISAGGGKTAIILKMVARIIEQLVECGGVAIYEPTHVKAAEVVGDLINLGVPDTDIATHRGYTAAVVEPRIDLCAAVVKGKYARMKVNGHIAQFALDGDGKPYEAMCLRVEDKVAFERAGGSMSEMCKVCPLASVCQKEVNRVETCRAAIVGAAHATLHNVPPAALAEKLVRIIDENFLDTSLSGTPTKVQIKRGLPVAAMAQIPPSAKVYGDHERDGFALTAEEVEESRQEKLAALAEAEEDARATWRALTEAFTDIFPVDKIHDKSPLHVEPLPLQVIKNYVGAGGSVDDALDALRKTRAFHLRQAKLFRDRANYAPGEMAGWVKDRNSGVRAQAHHKRATILGTLARRLTGAAEGEGDLPVAGDITIASDGEQLHLCSDRYVGVSEETVADSFVIVLTATPGRLVDLERALGMPVERLCKIDIENHSSVKVVQVINAIGSATSLGATDKDENYTVRHQANRRSLARVAKTFQGMRGGSGVVISRDDVVDLVLDEVPEMDGCNFAVAPGLNTFKNAATLLVINQPDPGSFEIVSRARKFSGEWYPDTAMVRRQGFIQVKCGGVAAVEYSTYEDETLRALHDAQVRHAIEQAMHRSRAVRPSSKTPDRLVVVISNQPLECEVDEVIDWRHISAEVDIECMMSRFGVVSSATKLAEKYPDICHSVYQAESLLEVIVRPSRAAWLGFARVLPTTGKLSGSHVDLDIWTRADVSHTMAFFDAERSTASALDQYVSEQERDGFVMLGRAAPQLLTNGNVTADQARMLADNYVPPPGWLEVQYRSGRQRGEWPKGFAVDLATAQSVAQARLGEGAQVRLIVGVAAEAEEEHSRSVFTDVPPPAPWISGKPKVTKEEAERRDRRLARKAERKIELDFDVRAIVDQLAALDVVAIGPVMMGRVHGDLVPAKLVKAVIANITKRGLSADKAVVSVSFAAEDGSKAVGPRVRFIVRRGADAPDVISRLAGKPVHTISATS